MGRPTSGNLRSLWVQIVRSEEGLGKASIEFGTGGRNGRFLLLSLGRELSRWLDGVQ
jgi:hypothetical protein